MVSLLYKRNVAPDDYVLDLLERALTTAGHSVFVDRHLKIGVEWAQKIEESIRVSDVVIAILSDAASGSEMLEYELETASNQFQSGGSPRVLPIRIGEMKPISGPIGLIVNGLQFAQWTDPSDDDKLVAEILSAIEKRDDDEDLDSVKLERIEATGGAVPPNSGFYTKRATDHEFEDALQANESVILVKGPRQVGKSSLLGRGIQLVDGLGWRGVTTDFQILSSFQLLHEDHAMRVFAELLARQSKFHYDFKWEWLDVFGPSINLDNFMRALLEASDKPLVWFMDEADRVFNTPFSNDFFGVVRSWHNARARDPKGPWNRFTVVISYATEARLFIRDLNQSPFNVGRQIGLQNFSLDQVSDLNRKYGSPLKRESDLEALHFLVAGQPFLTRRALEVLANGRLTFRTLIETADHDDGPFGDHLKRMLIAVSHTPNVLNAIRVSLSMRQQSSSDGVDRLIAAGVLKESSDGNIDLACDLYTRYLSRLL